MRISEEGEGGRHDAEDEERGGKTSDNETNLLCESNESYTYLIL